MLDNNLNNVTIYLRKQLTLQFLSQYRIQLAWYAGTIDVQFCFFLAAICVSVKTVLLRFMEVVLTAKAESGIGFLSSYRYNFEL
jgi:hypothetical protein